MQPDNPSQPPAPMNTVRHIMSFAALTVEANDRLSDVIGRLRRIGHEGFPVLDAGQVVGLLTARDFNRAAENQLDNLLVRDVMQAGHVAVSPDDNISDVLSVMQNSEWGQLPVIENDVLIGIVTRTDVIRYYAQIVTTAPPPRTISSDDVARVLGETTAGIIAAVAAAGTDANLTIYMVGGVVRDLLLGRTNDDIDFVIEGDAIAFAETLKARFGGETHAHPPFGTSKWTPDAQMAAKLGCAVDELPPTLDFATARFEFYEQPAVLPTVYSSNIKLDLRRRDFTINALAVKLNQDASGIVVDLFNGLADLESGVIRALHSLSFADDPTRTLRAVRFAHRLNFTIEPHTSTLIQTALPMMGRITGERLQNELTLLLNENQPEIALLQLQDMGVLSAIDPAFTLNENVREVFERARGSLPTEPEKPRIFPWLLIATTLPPNAVIAIAERLLFGKGMTKTLTSAAAIAQTPGAYLGGSPAAITFRLEKIPHDALLAAWAALDTVNRDRIVRFLNEWQHVETATNGSTLKDHGLPPGPAYATILRTLRAARLNDEITNDEAESAYLQTLLQQYRDSNHDDH